MFKLKLARAHLLIPIGAAVLAGFQNCAPQASFEAMSEDFASTSQSFNVLHEDSDRTTPGEDKARLETNYEPLLVDRHYIRSLIEDVFGTRGPAIAPGPTIFQSADEFGSNCSVYEDFSVKRASDGAVVRYDNSAACTQGSAFFTQAPANPKATAKRQAYMTAYCSNLVNDATAFANALKKISSDGKPKATTENVYKLFRLFYRAHPEPQQGLLDSLQLMFSSATPDPSEWKGPLNVVCASSRWQVL